MFAVVPDDGRTATYFAALTLEACITAASPAWLAAHRLHRCHGLIMPPHAA
ncbi:hypothetical protein [Xanthomonas phage M29]|nr:hypothetical protein [Xanthomonas phage M29]